MTNATRRNNIIIVLSLLLLCLLPPCLAVVFYQHPNWLGQSTTNQGQLVRQATQLSSLPKSSANWHLLLLNDKPCRDNCMHQMAALARTRLALGRHGRDIDLAVAVGRSSDLPDPLNQKRLQSIAAGTYQLSNNDQRQLASLGYQRGIIIVDARGYVVLYYPPFSQEKPIFQDLKHLVNL